MEQKETRNDREDTIGRCRNERGKTAERTKPRDDGKKETKQNIAL